MRKLPVWLLVLSTLCLAGCTRTTTLQQPGTGATASCSGFLPDINLWSGYQLCVENYVSAGYRPQ